MGIYLIMHKGTKTDYLIVLIQGGIGEPLVQEKVLRPTSSWQDLSPPNGSRQEALRHRTWRLRSEVRW